VDYRNARQDPRHLEEMLHHTEGRRDVPVIVENGRVTIGYGGT
jgi:glutaredoxin 3